MSFCNSAGFITNGWAWVPGVYFAEGLPFAVATCVSMVIFTSMGMSNRAMTFWTGIIALPWSVKFQWAPFLDSVWTKRGWMLTEQFLLSLCFAAVALAFHSDSPQLALVVGLFIFTAFCSVDSATRMARNANISIFSFGFAFVPLPALFPYSWSKKILIRSSGKRKSPEQTPKNEVEL